MNLSYPLSIKLNITKKCNLRCSHCFIEEYENELSLDNVINLIDDFNKNKLGIIFITGGEPLLYSNIYKVLEYLKSYNIPTCIASNGTLIDKDIARKLSEYNINNIQISIDGYNDEIHDSIRGYGSFKRAIEGINNLIECKINVIIGYVINNKNIDYIEEIIFLGEKLGVKAIRFELYLPIALEPDKDELSLTSKDIEKIHSKLLNIKNNNFKVEIILPVFNSSIGCGAGVFNAVINPDLTMSPCDLLSEVLYSIPIDKSNTIKKIWNNSDTFKDWRQNKVEIKNNNCNKCKNNNSCGFGCRASSYAYNKNLWEDDPICMTKFKE